MLIEAAMVFGGMAGDGIGKICSTAAAEESGESKKALRIKIKEKNMTIIAHMIA